MAKDTEKRRAKRVLADSTKVIKEFYGTCLIKTRRTKKVIAALDDALWALCCMYRPVSIRQIYYQCSVRGLIEKTHGDYKAVCRRLAILRRECRIPYLWIADGTRWQRKPATHSSLENMLTNTRECYRRQLWQNQDSRVEVWCEKEALAGTLYQTTAPWDVPLMICRGYPSVSFLHGAAAAIASNDKPTYLYYLGDHDPSGRDISRFVESEIRTLLEDHFYSDTEFYFKRIAVEQWQIKKWNLPTRPTKKSDSRSKSFKGESVELDAIEPDKLRQMVEDCITRHIDQDALEQLQAVEEAERETLATVIEGLGGAA